MHLYQIKINSPHKIACTLRLIYLTIPHDRSFVEFQTYNFSGSIQYYDDHTGTWTLNNKIHENKYPRSVDLVHMIPFFSKKIYQKSSFYVLKNWKQIRMLSMIYTTNLQTINVN
jgi:hypothetical protein